MYDYENHKIFRIRDEVFNEKVMYKDQLQRKKQEKEDTKYKMLDEIKENEIPKAPKIKMINNKKKYLKFL